VSKFYSKQIRIILENDKFLLEQFILVGNFEFYRNQTMVIDILLILS